MPEAIDGVQPDNSNGTPDRRLLSPRVQSAEGLTCRAASADVENRTVEVIFSTGAAVRRYGNLPDGSGFGQYIETLAIDPDAVDLDRMNGGAAPLLDSHSNYSTWSQLGVVVEGSARIENGQGICTVKFRDTPDADEVFRSVIDGTMRNVSVGYSVQLYEVQRGEDGPPIFTGRRWTPVEVSIVTIGADAQARVRSRPDTGQPCEFRYIDGNEDSQMPDENIETASADQPVQDRARTTSVFPPEARNNPDRDNITAAIAAARAGAEDDAAIARREAEARSAGAVAERQRISAIRDACRILGDGAEAFAGDLIERGIGLDAARAEIIERAAQAGEAVHIRGHNVQIGASSEDPAVMVRRMVEAAACRYTGAAPAEEARDYVGLSIVDMARDLLAARGENIRGMRAPKIIERALGTSDFPLLLQGTGDRLLLPSYDATPSTYQAIARRITNRDFRARKLIRDGDFPELKQVNEHGEYESGAMSESEETVKLISVGRRIMLTRQALVNDDLGAFADLARKAGEAARRYENSAVWGVITSNAKLSDNKALFHADHNNLAASGGAISVATVGAGKQAMRNQKNADGNLLNYQPRVIAVPSALETVAEQYLSNLVLPTKESDVVPASHKQLQPIVEPLLDAASATAWYLFADPSQLAAVVYAYLEGQEGPQMQQQDVSLAGMKMDVVLDFAAAPVEFRGAYKDPGA